MNRPWLSVLMPTYNGAPYLKATLDSIVRQQDKDVEIIAIDDGSTDNTIPILESYAHRLSTRVVKHCHVGNWVANTNDALAEATADHVCLLHQDDVWFPNRLTRLETPRWNGSSSRFVPPSCVVY